VVSRATIELADLLRELDCWAAVGRTATFWWRDDDATEASGALDRILSLTDTVPIALAVVPGSMTASLVNSVDRRRNVTVLQHGWRHSNHAPSGAPPAELGAHRAISEMSTELRQGCERLEGVFGSRFLPLLVPPWHQMTPLLLPVLARIGLRGVSGIGQRRSSSLYAGLDQLNVHVDPIDWEARGRFAGSVPCVRALCARLAARRSGHALDEPTGIVTHHLQSDLALFGFLENLIGLTAGHPAARWLDPATALSPRHEGAGARGTADR
jgi:hypothetical protein